MKKYKICVIGEPEELRNKICEKLSKFFDVPHFDIPKLSCSSKDELDFDDLSDARLKLSILSENHDAFVINGFPISEADCCCLEDVDLVVFLDLDKNKAIETNQHRRWCPTCFKTYHLKQKPPLKENLCDRCGSEITILKNDFPRTIDNMILDWYKLYSKVLEFYRSKDKLLEIKNKNEDEISSLIFRILSGKIKPKKYRNNKKFDKVFEN